MNNFRIIETSNNYPDVLLYRDRNESGEEVVNLLAIGKIDGGDDMFAGEKAKFDSAQSAQAFIRDFSVRSAEEFCKREKVKY